VTSTVAPILGPATRTVNSVPGIARNALKQTLAPVARNLDQVAAPATSAPGQGASEVLGGATAGGGVPPTGGSTASLAAQQVAGWRTIGAPAAPSIPPLLGLPGGIALVPLGDWLSVAALSGADRSASPSGVPSGPAPGPLQGTALPASAAASGFAISIFLTLAGLLVLGALWAARRLRLSSELWRLAPYVLVPDRPG
jgi:hypothetical protein